MVKIRTLTWGVLCFICRVASSPFNPGMVMSINTTSGYVVKTTAISGLISAIRAVYQGDVYLYPSIARMLVEDYLQKVKTGEEKGSYEGLTSREREILMYIAEDKKNKEIADLLGISVRTVQAHRTNLMDKLGAHDRTELVKFAISKGIIDL